MPNLCVTKTFMRDEYGFKRQIDFLSKFCSGTTFQALDLHESNERKQQSSLKYRKLVVKTCFKKESLFF